jgi:hypothetical protein
LPKLYQKGDVIRARNITIPMNIFPALYILLVLLFVP